MDGNRRHYYHCFNSDSLLTTQLHSFGGAIRNPFPEPDESQLRLVIRASLTSEASTPRRGASGQMPCDLPYVTGLCRRPTDLSAEPGLGHSAPAGPFFIFALENGHSFGSFISRFPVTSWWLSSLLLSPKPCTSPTWITYFVNREELISSFVSYLL